MLNAIKPKNVAKECKMTETKESKAMQVANWLTEKAVGGVGPLSSAEDLALEYLNNPDYEDNDPGLFGRIVDSASANGCGYCKNLWS